MLGYQQDDDWSGVGEGSAEYPGTTPLILTAGMAGGMLFYDLLAWLFNGGGTISIVGSLIAVHARKASIDVDESGLNFAIVILLCAVLLAACRVFGIKRLSKPWSALALVALMSCMLVFNLAWESDLMAGYLAAHEYHRCPSRDHTVGSGKGEVWFQNYSLDGAPCT